MLRLKRFEKAELVQARLGFGGCAGSRCSASSHRSPTAVQSRRASRSSGSDGSTSRFRLHDHRCRWYCPGVAWSTSTSATRRRASRRSTTGGSGTARPDRSSTTTSATRWWRHEGWLVKPVWRSNLWGPQADVDGILERGLVEARQRLVREAASTPSLSRPSRRPADAPTQYDSDLQTRRLAPQRPADVPTRQKTMSPALRRERRRLRASSRMSFASASERRSFT